MYSPQTFYQVLLWAASRQGTVEHACQVLPGVPSSKKEDDESIESAFHLKPCWNSFVMWMMILGAILGVLFGMVGMYSSYYLDIPSGPAIGLTVFGGFLLALLFSPRQGILIRYWQA